MSPGQKSLLTWAVIILLVSYLANINLSHFISSVLNAAQQVHNSGIGH